MAKIRTLGPGSLVIGSADAERNLSADVESVTLEPKVDTDDSIVFLDGTEEAGAQTITWTLSGSIKEDYSMEGSQVWAAQNAGKTMPFVFVPNDDGGVEWAGDLSVAPISVGGDVKSKNSVDFSFTATNVEPRPHTKG